MNDYAPYVKALQNCERYTVVLERRVAELERENSQLKCQHAWQEQPGEPPVDVCSSCGKVRS